MELMIFAIDALPPDILIENIDDYKNIKSLIDKGIFCDYDAYAYGYGSRDNWISLYTGLIPEVHGCINNSFKDENRYPNTNDYKDKKPFWSELNKRGITTGIWRGLSTTPPLEVDGYMISGEINYELENNDEHNSIEPIVVEKDLWILNELEGKLNKNPIPRSFKKYYDGFDKEKSQEIISKLLNKDYFLDGFNFLKDELEYYKKNIVKVQRKNPVDVCFYYNQLIDFISHFQSHDLDKEIIKASIGLIDKFIGDIINEINPKNIIVISDHGIKGWHEYFLGYKREDQKELFGLSDEAYWLNNGSIVIEGRNGGLLSACHDIKGTFIAVGEKFQNKKIANMRTIDFYPTLLEMFDIDVPLDREGKVLNIFNKTKINNANIVLNEKEHNGKILVIQNVDIPNLNTILNKIFLKNRFYSLYVLGEKKYEKALKLNTRVKKFIKNGTIGKKEMFETYDKIIIPYYNKQNKKLSYYVIE